MHAQAFAKAMNIYELKKKPLAMFQRALWPHVYPFFVNYISPISIFS